MKLDTWIYIKPSAWNALAVGAFEIQPLNLYNQAVTGYWKTFTGGFEVYNVLGSQTDITELTDTLETQETGSVARLFSWTWRKGTDSLDVNPTIPADVVAVMRDHVVTDFDGNEISRVAATAANPNFGHTFSGQKPRIVAGDHSNDFSEDFF